MTDTNEIRIRWAGKPPPSAPPDPEVDATTEGLWLDLTGGSWMHAQGNPAALLYAVRSAAAGLPMNDKVHYVHVGNLGHLVHESEIIT